MVRLAVFDLDGTLVDSRRDLANAANALVAELGGPPLSEESVGAMVGEGAAVLVRRVLAAAGLDPELPGMLSRFLELYDERLVEYTRPYPGMADVLESLAARMSLAVLTNKPQRPTERLLATLDLTRYFRWIVGGDTPHGRKPDPAGLRHICAAAGVTPADAVLVGDSPIDFHTTRHAGTGVILARYGFGFRFDASAIVDLPVAETPADILRYI